MGRDEREMEGVAGEGGGDERGRGGIGGMRRMRRGGGGRVSRKKV
jgi:hypothetical protein